MPTSLQAMRSPSGVLLLLVLSATPVPVRAAPSGPVPPSDALALVRQLYAQSHPPQLVAYVTGGAAQLPSWLLATPGASRSVLDFQMPYSRGSVDQLLSRTPPRYCSAAVARDLATAAFERARTLRPSAAGAAPCVGLGLTAVLMSEPMRKGSHRCLLAVRTERGLHEVSLILSKGARSRSREDAVCSRLALLALAESVGVKPPDGDAFWRLPADDAEHDKLVAEEQLEIHRSA